MWLGGGYMSVWRSDDGMVSFRSVWSVLLLYFLRPSHACF